MKEWKYLIGSAEHFNDAPSWATVYLQHNNGRFAFAESLTMGSVRTEMHGNGTCRLVAPGEWTLIAQRTESFGNAIDLEFCKANPDHPDCKCKPANVTIHNKSSEAVDIASLITERGNKYGSFKDGAEIMRDLKNAMHSTDGWEKLSPSQQEALDMIQHKIGRVLNGDPNYDDNWKDIAGYATLIAEELSGNIK